MAGDCRPFWCGTVNVLGKILSMKTNCKTEKYTSAPNINRFILKSNFID